MCEDTLSLPTASIAGCLCVAGEAAGDNKDARVSIAEDMLEEEGMLACGSAAMSGWVRARLSHDTLRAVRQLTRSSSGDAPGRVYPAGGCHESWPVVLKPLVDDIYTL